MRNAPYTATGAFPYINKIANTINSSIVNKSRFGHRSYTAVYYVYFGIRSMVSAGDGQSIALCPRLWSKTKKTSGHIRSTPMAGRGLVGTDGTLLLLPIEKRL